MSDLIQVLFVCTGNICRSPTAEGLMRFRIKEAGLEDQIEVESAGTQNHHLGSPPDERSCAAVAALGVDITGIRARRVDADDFSRFDIIAAMDRSHVQNLQGRSPPSFRNRISLLMSFAPRGGSLEVPDPYYGGPEGFRRVLKMIDSGVTGLLEHIKQKHLAAPGKPA